jgi:outer membrane protein OmpA-like peptidoglycan-associated protein
MKRVGRNIRESVAALAVALLGVLATYGQSGKGSQAARQGQSIRQLADGYWQYEQFAEAAKYYQKLIGLNPDDLAVTYRLAECNRHLFRYPAAEAGYGKVHYTDPAAYPEALFHYATMQKLNGKYAYAIGNFEKFLVLVKAATPEGWANRDEWMARATLEKDGCHFALLREKFARREFNFALLPPPVSTPGNDYAPVIFSHDTALLVTSGRVLDSTRMTDTRLGESFSDFYALHKREEVWEAAAAPGDLPGVLNTRWNEGTGCFNGDQTKFYYANCSEPDASCKLYLTTLRGGKWGKPVRLNRNVNVPGADARHPALSLTGDTLFFVSDRPGGMGQNDLWMSVSTGGEEWSPAVNLGKAINTPRNELSPFVNPGDGKFLFASDGHLGLGGLDLYGVTRQPGATPEVANLGPPFNSNRDDLFLVMGTHKGYLASNRSGGPGGFDLYTFDNFSHSAVIAGVNDQGRHEASRFYYFQEFNLEYLSDEDKLSLDRVSSRKEAGKVYRQEMPLTEQDLYFYERLSQEEKGRLERLVAYNIERQGGEETIRAEDQAFYSSLSPEEKARICRFAASYRSAMLNKQRLVLEKHDAYYYEKLSSDGNRLLDRVVAARLGQLVENNDSSSLAGEPFNCEKLHVAGQAPAEWERGARAGNVPEPPPTDDPYRYAKLDAAERDRLTRSRGDRTAAGRGTNDLSGLEDDNFRYEKLSDADKDRIDRMAAARYAAQLAGGDEKFTEEDQFYYASLPAEDRSHLDRAINLRIAREAPGQDTSALAEPAYVYEKMPGQAPQRTGTSRKGRPLAAAAPKWPEGDSYRNNLAALNSFEMGSYKSFTVKGRLLNAMANAPASGLTIPLVNEKGEVLKTTWTNPDGSFAYVNLTVPENYRLLLQTPPARVDQPAEYYVEDLEVLAYHEAGASVQFEPVFFGFNAWGLEENARKTLDALAAYCRQHPGVQIELNAFTDQVGNDTYNLELSRKRGQAVQQYLVQKGVLPGTLVTNARGKRLPGTAEKGNANASDRCVELALKGAPAQSLEADAFVITPLTDLLKIAEKFGVPVKQLRELNGLTGDRVEPFRLLKIKRL